MRTQKSRFMFMLAVIVMLAAFPFSAGASHAWGNYHWARTSNPVSQVFFDAEGHILKVNGADVQVFEYESPEAMENEASLVSSDGGSIGTSMVAWVDVPHFYKASRMIVLYVGNDAAVLDLLENALGPQFAGR